jgi:hypothetical protein
MIRPTTNIFEFSNVPKNIIEKLSDEKVSAVLVVNKLTIEP